VITSKPLRKKAKDALRFANRFLEEQANYNDDGSIVAKPAKEIPSGSLQSANDWEAAYKTNCEYVEWQSVTTRSV
jgi:hypothetical protein